MPVALGEVIDGKYRIERLLGEGGMGAVFEAENVRIRRRVAIKLLHPHVAEMGAIVQRFEREAQAAGRIGNDHIMEVLDLGTLPDGSRYIVMEYLDGEPLAMRIERLGKIPARELAELTLQTLEGLGAAHAAGIVHRDLKPDNIYILKEKAGRRDFVKLIDFGISKFQRGGPEGMQMTQTGAVLGTPYYMSPEQAAGSQEVNASTDLYAIGVILFEAATGRRPFESDSFQQLLFQIVLADLPNPKTLNPELDDGFASIILKAMSRDPASRFESAAAFSTALREWLESGKAVQVPPRSTLNPALAGIVAPTLMEEASPVAGVTAGNDTSAAGSWAQSHAFETQPPRKGKGLLIGAGVAVLAIAAIAVVALVRIGSRAQASSATPEPSAAAAAAAASPGPDTPAVPELPAPPNDTAAPAAGPSPAHPGLPSLPRIPGQPLPLAPSGAAAPPPPPPSATPEPPPAPPPPPVVPPPRPPKPKPTGQPGTDFGY